MLAAVLSLTPLAAPGPLGDAARAPPLSLPRIRTRSSSSKAVAPVYLITAIQELRLLKATPGGSN